MMNLLLNMSDKFSGELRRGCSMAASGSDVNV